MKPINNFSTFPLILTPSKVSGYVNSLHESEYPKGSMAEARPCVELLLLHSLITT